MLETNIRIVYPGANLYVLVRKVEVVGSDLSPDLIERVCSKLRYHHGIAAVRENGNASTLLVAATSRIPHIRLTDDEWEIEIFDQSENNERLFLTSPEGAIAIPLLIERALSARLKRLSDFWSLDSPRIWYEARPFKAYDDIHAYRRYEFGTVFIDGVGIGIAVDVGTAFFTTHSLAYYFDPTASTYERKQRKQAFERLTNRQSGQKGTLLYDYEYSKSKCYFEQAPEGMTCATTGVIRAKGQSYGSLTEYYEKVYPNLQFDETGPAVRVSFPGIDRPTPVAAEKVFIRVMNDALPRAMQSIDKIEPAARRRHIQRFWDCLGDRPFGQVAPGISPAFWQPSSTYTHQFHLPPLSFGNQHTLPTPVCPDEDMYRHHYRQRTKALQTYGCYYVPPTMTRVLHIAIPESVDVEVGKRLAHDLVARIRTWTNIPIEPEIISYTSVTHAVDQLQETTQGQSGCVVFVLNDESTAYYDIAFRLGHWRVKRITTDTLCQQYGYLHEGYVSRGSSIPDKHKGENRWLNFIEKNTLAVIQLLDVLPFRIPQSGIYEALLAIDVGYDRRHLALSILIARDECKKRHFELVTNVHVKSDHQHESINPVILRDQLIDLVKTALGRYAKSLASLLVVRDGRFCGQEMDGIDDAIEYLKTYDLLEHDASVDLVELRKDPLLPIRLWDVQENQVTNPLEGWGVQLNTSMVVVTATGAATLTQGTADPYLVVSNGRCSHVRIAAQATFDATQLNYSSPGVAQRLPLPLKRTDEELQARATQEIRRLQ